MSTRNIRMIAIFAIVGLMACSDDTNDDTTADTATTDTGSDDTAEGDTTEGDMTEGDMTADADMVEVPTGEEFCAAMCGTLDECGLLHGISEEACATFCGDDVGDCDDAGILDAVACGDTAFADDACDLGWFDCISAIDCVDAAPPAPPEPSEYCTDLCAELERCELLPPPLTAAGCVGFCTPDFDNCEGADVWDAVDCGDAAFEDEACDLSWYECTAAIDCIETAPPAPPAPTTYCASFCGAADTCSWLGEVSVEDCNTNCASDLEDCSFGEMFVIAGCDQEHVPECSTDWWDCSGAVECVDNPLPNPDD